MASSAVPNIAVVRHIGEPVNPANPVCDAMQSFVTTRWSTFSLVKDEHEAASSVRAAWGISDDVFYWFRVFVDRSYTDEYNDDLGNYKDAFNAIVFRVGHVEVLVGYE